MNAPFTSSPINVMKSAVHAQEVLGLLLLHVLTRSF